MNEAKARRMTQQLYDDYHRARRIYTRARAEAFAEAEELLEPLRATAEEILAAYQKSLATLVEYTTPHPKPGDTA